MLTLKRLEAHMTSLRIYVDERKKRDKAFARRYEEGYEQFKVGVLLREARESAGFTQDEVARRLKTKKTAISRIENHAEDIKLSTLERFAAALGKKLTVQITSESVDGVAEANSAYHVGRQRSKRLLSGKNSTQQKGKAIQQTQRNKKFREAVEKINRQHAITLRKLAGK
jgi:transcriptional regulator with XRE-family HTH domain